MLMDGARRPTQGRVSRPEWKVTDLSGAWLVELANDDTRTEHGAMFEEDYFDREAAEMVCNALNSWERAREARARFERGAP